MGFYLAKQVIKLMIQKGQQIADARVLMLGITFKENCPDIRNSRAIDVVTELTDFGCKVEVYDPLANPEEVKKEFGIALSPTLSGSYDSVVLAVAHDQFKTLNIKTLCNGHGILYDIKDLLPKEIVDGRL